MLGWILGGVVVLAVVGTAGLAVWARIAPETPADWHVDPMTVERPASPNTALVAPEGAESRTDRAAPVFDAPPERLMQAVAEVAESRPRTELIAGSVGDRHVTWRVRSAIMGWPDYVTVRALPSEEGGATLAIYSRSRFGESDFGVNAARVSAWLEAVQGRLQ
ncbi:MAG: DUF1499 domain-containing protein [Paracoccaceae bacterium]